MQVELPPESLDSDSVASYLTHRVSGSVVYVLTLQQPLTLKELEGHPLRLRYLSLLTGKEAKPTGLRKVVSRGVDAGLLVPLTTRREYYYFLRSDLSIRPPSLTGDAGGLEVARSGADGAEDDLVLPPTCSLGTGHPVPLLPDPSAFLGWTDWLTDPRKRAVLRALQEAGPLTRKELADRQAPLDLPTTWTAVRLGVLRLRDDRVDFPFARVPVAQDGGPWTLRPPRAWLTPSYEPLRCIQESDAYLADAGRRAPMALLEEMAQDGRKVVPSHRRKGVATNLLYEPAAVLPAIQEIGPATLPAVLENRRGWVFPVEGGYARAQAAAELEAELQQALPAGTEVAPDLLTRMARRKVEAYFRERERDLARRFQEERRRGYGLGTDAIMDLASEELERGRLQEERKHFERFLDVLDA